MWKPITGYRYPYRISELAEVERKSKTGKWIRLKAYREERRYGINMAIFPKGHRFVSLSSLMEGRWVPKRKTGETYRHKNGLRHDYSAENLEICTQKEMAKRQNGPGRRAVFKIDQDGNVLEVYRSVSEAARENHMDRGTVHRRCSGKIKRPFDLTGFSFQYEDKDGRRKFECQKRDC